MEQALGKLSPPQTHHCTQSANQIHANEMSTETADRSSSAPSNPAPAKLANQSQDNKPTNQQPAQTSNDNSRSGCIEDTVPDSEAMESLSAQHNVNLVSRSPLRRSRRIRALSLPAESATDFADIVPEAFQPEEEQASKENLSETKNRTPCR